MTAPCSFGGEAVYAATDGRYTLCVHYDEYAESPREWDNLGRMICFHSRYSLGDKHSYGNPIDFLRDAYAHAISDGGKALVRYLKSGKAHGAYLEYNRHTHEWDLHECTYLRTVLGRSEPAWEVTQSAPKSQLRDDGWFWDYLLESLTESDLVELLNALPDCVLLPLYLYDHSGITMNTGGFSCPWDSGQVGWIFADGNTIRKEYSNANRQSVATAESVLEGEVSVYDDFIRGDCWYFRLYENGEEVDSCGGFYGDVEKSGIEEYLPDEAKPLLGQLTWTEVSESSYLCA